MRILIIRHGDPDYSIDSLTPTGWKEAELVADRISKLDVKDFYVSPLGRAKDTASLTLKKMNRTATEYPWLREFAPQIHRPDVPDETKNVWDWLPQDWTKEEEFYRHDLWMHQEIMEEGKVVEEYEWVSKGLDSVLAEHGYERDGENYKVVAPNRDTIVFFCHFGVECVMLSHLMNVSPMILWHHMCAAPTSVTTIYTEERRKGIASFRVSSFGDVSHLYAAGREPSFSARFCETYDCMEERHD